MATLRLEVITAERQVVSEEVDMVTAPGTEGELGILPRHAPLLTMLQPGLMRVRRGGEQVDLAISGGFMEVLPDKVVVLADAAERAEEIDVARAEEARRRARAALEARGADVDIALTEAALKRALARLKVAGRRRSRSGVAPQPHG